MGNKINENTLSSFHISESQHRTQDFCGRPQACKFVSKGIFAVVQCYRCTFPAPNNNGSVVAVHNFAALIIFHFGKSEQYLLCSELNMVACLYYIVQ